jgi:hypothetical protein
LSFLPFQTMVRMKSQVITKFKIFKTDSDSIHALTDKPALILTTISCFGVRELKANHGLHHVRVSNRDGN